MKFEEFIERMTDNGCSNTACCPQQCCYLPPKSIKLVDPQNPSEQHTINQDYSHLLYCLDEENKTAIAYYGYYDKDFKYMSQFEKSQDVEDCPNDQEIPYIVIPEEIEFHGVSYAITGLYVRSTAWQIQLSQQLKDLYIDKREQSSNALMNHFGNDEPSLKDVTIRFGNSINSYFINNDNPNFAPSPDGESLYSADKKHLYHAFVGYPSFNEWVNGYYDKDFYLDEELETIAQGAFQGIKCGNLIIPKGVIRVEDGTFTSAKIKRVHFMGHLDYISDSDQIICCCRK